MAVSVPDYDRRKNLYDAIQKGYVSDPNDPRYQYEGGGDSNEVLFAQRSKPKPKGPTGPTGPVQPKPGQPKPVNPNNPFANNDALNAAMQKHDQIQAETWQEHMANMAQQAREHFESPPTPPVPPQGMTLREMLQQGNSQGLDTVKNPNVGYDWVNTPAAPTTQDKQNELLNNAIVPGQGGGVLPAWNSPTGQNLDLSASAPRTIQVEPATPTGWLDRAIAAARTGANNYTTGATPETVKAGQQYPSGQIDSSGSYAATPSGGTIGLPSGNLVDAINRSQTPAKFNTDQAQRTADQNQGGY